MKKIIYSLMLIGSVIGLTGCHEITTEDTSKITYYITYDMQGDQVMNVPMGSVFNDPGVIAMEGTNDVSSSVVVTGTVNTAAVGVFTLTYSATNVDGFASSVTRTVVVYDPAANPADISGTYALAPGSKRVRAGATVSYSGYPVEVTKVAPGLFYVSDYFAGYYDKRAAYGSSYAMFGYLQLNSDNTLSMISSFNNGWSDGLDALRNGLYTPGAGSAATLYWEADYAGSMTFFVTLTK